MDFYEFSSTTPAQTELYGVDFTNNLNTGEDIVTSSISVSISVIYGNDPNPSSRLINSPTLTGNILTQLVGNCIASSNYCINFAVNTTFGQTLSESVQLMCNDICSNTWF